MEILVNSLRRLYLAKKVSLEKLQEMVKNGTITEENYRVICGYAIEKE